MTHLFELLFFECTLIPGKILCGGHTTEIPEPSPFLSRMGLKLGVFAFSSNQNNSGLSGVYVTCIYCGVSASEDKHL